MKHRRMIVGCLVALLLAGCDPVEPVNTEPSAPEQNYTPGELTYYVNLPQAMHWSLSTYMESDVYAMVLSSRNLDALEHHVLEDDLFVNNGGMTISPLEDEAAAEYPLYLYQTYRGMDWEQLVKLKQEADAGNADSAAKLEEYEQLYADDFAALSAEDLPQVYPYLLHIQTGYDEANFAKRGHSVEIQLGQDAVTVPLGTLDVTDLPLWEGLLEAEELPQKALDAVQVSYWTDTAELPAMQIKRTSKPQVLTGVAYYGGEVELSNICLTWEENGETVTHQWDGTSPITIPAFADATLSATLHHAGKSVMGYCAGGYLAISREYEEKDQRLWYSLPLTQYWNVYELYAMVVDGIDLAPYYAYAQGYAPAEAQNVELEPEHTFDKMLLQQDGFSVTALNAYADNFGYTLTLELENSSEEDTEFFFGRTHVNGYLYQRGTSFKVPAENQITAEIFFPWEEMEFCGFTEKSANAFELIELSIGNGDGDVQHSALYINGTDVMLKPTVTPEMTKLVDTEKYELWVIEDRIPQPSIMEHGKPPRDEYVSKILFVNKSDQSLVLKTNDVKVNGKTTDGIYAGTVAAGRYVIDEYTLFQPSYYSWTDVESVTLSFVVYTSDWEETHTATYYPNVPLS